MTSSLPFRTPQFRIQYPSAALLLWAVATSAAAAAPLSPAPPGVMVALPVSVAPPRDVIAPGPVSRVDSHGSAHIEAMETAAGEWVLKLSPASGIPQSVALPLMGTPQQVYRAGHRLIVLGREGGGLSTVVLIDAQRGQVLDRFTGFRPVLSPDRRWIAFTRFHPLGGGPRNPEDQWRLYQVTASAAENRRDVPRALVAERDGEGLWDLAGQPLFPLGPQRWRDNFRVTEGDSHYLVSDSVWAPDSRQVAMVSLHRGVYRLVVARADPLAVHGWRTDSSVIAQPGAWCLPRTRAPGCHDGGLPREDVGLGFGADAVVVQGRLAATGQVRTVSVPLSALQPVQ